MTPAEKVSTTLPRRIEEATARGGTLTFLMGDRPEPVESLRSSRLRYRAFVRDYKARQLDEEAAAADNHVPVEAVREALAYVERNRELLETEAEIERLMLKRGGVARGPQPVP